MLNSPGLKKHGQFIEHFCVSSMLKPITDYLHICTSVMKKYKARVKKCQLYIYLIFDLSFSKNI